jgi:hypothetical protein
MTQARAVKGSPKTGSVLGLDDLQGIVEDAMTEARKLVEPNKTIDANTHKFTMQVPFFLTCMRVNPVQYMLLVPFTSWQ